MDQIKAGTVVAFARSTWGISADRPYTVRADPAAGLFIYDDDGDQRFCCVQNADSYQSKGGYIVQHPADPASDTRTALIEALKARFTTLKDVPMHGPDLTEHRQKACISLLLSSGFGIKAEVVPGPSTVTFTELANNH